MRRDGQFDEIRKPFVQFQSTRLRETRPAGQIHRQPAKSFNPRAYVRRDYDDYTQLLKDVFQSTRLRETRLCC